MKYMAVIRNHTIMFTLMLMVAGITLVSVRAYALNPQEELQASAIDYAYTHFGEKQAFLEIKADPPSTAVVQKLVSAGGFPNYVDELKALGYTDVDYSAVSGGSSTPAQTETTETPETTPASESAPEPVAFTVEDMEDTPMWATQVVNYRDGATTDYSKIGSLNQSDQVIVNGIASTGWYRFNTSDGKTAYVSDKYLTTEDPNNSGMDASKEENQPTDTNNVEDEETEAIDESVKDIKQESEDETPVVEGPEPAPEEIAESEPIEEPVTEPTAEEPAVEETSSHWQFIVGAILCVIIVVVVVYYLIRSKKQSRVE